MYFWENSPRRAHVFAKDRRIENHCIVGAALHLGHCLDLVESESLSYLSSAYPFLVETLKTAEAPLPKNRAGKGSSPGDLLLRDLDCAVINFLHTQRSEGGKKRF